MKYYAKLKQWPIPVGKKGSRYCIAWFWDKEEAIEYLRNLNKRKK